MLLDVLTKTGFEQFQIFAVFVLFLNKCIKHK